jgi:hypothetical protein
VRGPRNANIIATTTSLMAATPAPLSQEAMQKPVQRTFTVTRILRTGSSQRGDPFVEADTNLGIVAFWGGALDQANLSSIQSTAVPFSVSCGCIQPSAAYAARHSYWVPEKSRLLDIAPVAVRATGERQLDLARWPNAQHLVARFAYWLDEYDHGGPFRKPEQLKWHRNTIDRRLAIGSAVASLQDETFLRSLYETLRAWGIGSRESRLRPYQAFADELSRHTNYVSALETFTIDDERLDAGDVGQGVWTLLDRLSIVDNKAKLVSGTKTLHHVLPDLVVPMDRAYTQAFFGWHNPQFQYGQRECFLEAFEAFACIARSVNPASYVGPDWRSSRTKILDNAVVALVQDQRRPIRDRTSTA